jgi:ABC-type transporter Mla maintaining outer membrane lipid asymmetry ATPase subunit MlaF
MRGLVRVGVDRMLVILGASGSGKSSVKVKSMVYRRGGVRVYQWAEREAPARALVP